MFIPLVLSEDQSDLAAAVRGLMHDRAHEERLRATVTSENGHDVELWKLMGDIGVLGISIPEEHGGVGLGNPELFLAFRETGRVLLSSPLFATVALAANVLMYACKPARSATYLKQIAAGDLRGTVGMCSTNGSWALEDVDVAATPTSPRSSEFTLDGTSRFVIDAQSADILLIVARTTDGLGVFAVDSTDDSLSVDPLETLDLTRRMSDVTMIRTKAVLLSSPEATAGLRKALQHAIVALVAEQVGASEFLLTSAIEYAKVRSQFGRPIAQFQAVRHKLVDMTFDLERSVSAGWHLATTSAEDTHAFTTAVHLAKSFCSEAFFRLAAEHIQVHGGIGFTWEHPAHLYFRRAKSTEYILAGPAAHRRALFDQLAECPQYPEDTRTEEARQ